MPELGDETPKVWAVKFPTTERQWQVRDLPLSTLERIAVTNNTNWFFVVGAPLQNAVVAEEIVREASRMIGEEAQLPEAFTGRNILDYFVQVDDDIPDAALQASKDPPTGAAT